MRRREFLGVVGGAAAWPLAARAQQLERVRRIGILSFYSQPDHESQTRIEAFLDTLQRMGWAEGRNVQIEYRWTGGDAARQKAFTEELVRSTPDAIVVAGWEALDELHRFTNTIPTVFTQVSDPVGAGFVKSLARPSTNITGFQNFEFAMGGKWLGLLKEVAPNMRRAVVLSSSDSGANAEMLHVAEAVGRALDVHVTSVNISDGVDEGVIAAFASQSDGGLIALPNRNVPTSRASIMRLATRYRLPAVYPYRYFPVEGGLMSYGPDQIEQWRGAATYVDRILRGEKPSELPVQAATKYEFVINLKTAKALGLEVPPALSARADEVIE
jgi:putative tryptophan/tyrosine transport system substrate-binding protein